MKSYYLYILANKNHRLYFGVTSNLQERMDQHTRGRRGFASFYKINNLVYFEEFIDPRDAIDREKQIKRRSRAKKTKLIESVNPDWEPITTY
jgi:putative endonuclease